MTSPTGMQETFITKIDVQEMRGIRDFVIELSDQERKHLIITGKNGSGKTSLLEAMRDLFFKVTLTNQEKSYDKYLERGKGDFYGIKPYFTRPAIEWAQDHRKGKFLIAYFGVQRLTKPEQPTGINKIGFNDHFNISDRIGPLFLRFIVNLQADKSFANEDGDTAAAQRIDQWFANFESRLREIFQAPELRLQFDRKNFSPRFLMVFWPS